MQVCFYLLIVIYNSELEGQTQAKFLNLITLHSSKIYFQKGRGGAGFWVDFLRYVIDLYICEPVRQCQRYILWYTTRISSASELISKEKTPEVN